MLSRQCGLLGDAKEEGKILDLPEQLKRLLKQSANSRPRAAAFGKTTFRYPIADGWSFLKGLRAKKDLIKSVVHAGPGALRAQRFPFLRIGRLFEIEETTIERLLTLNHLLRDYASRRFALRPLSIAVFGPAGAGKSFAVKEVVRSADLPLDPVFFSYNLSQLRVVDDLETAFHAVQSAVLRGNLPVVFWDEFDATLDHQKLGWIKYFLGPMQDGEFFARGVAHPLGRSVFVFAGATAYTFDNFVKKSNNQVSRDAKVPDFVSRIKASLDISQLPSSNTLAGGLHRAMLVHALMRQHAPHVNEIDNDVINLLVSDEFTTARELERAIEASALSDTNRFTRARLLFTGGKSVAK